MPLYQLLGESPSERMPLDPRGEPLRAKEKPQGENPLGLGLGAR